MKYGYGACASWNVVRLHFVAALLAGVQELAEIAIDAALSIEVIRDEFGSRGHEVISLRAIDGQGAMPIFEPGGLDQRGKVAAVIDVEVAEEDYVEVRHLRTALAEAKGAASSGVNERTRSAVFPDEIAARSALVLQFRPAGAEHLHGDALRAARLRRGGGQERATEEKDD